MSDIWKRIKSEEEINGDREAHACKMYKILDLVNGDRTSPLFHRPYTKSDSMFSMDFFLHSNELVWIFRNRAWGDTRSRKYYITTLWEYRQLFRQLLNGLNSDQKKLFIDEMRK